MTLADPDQALLEQSALKRIARQAPIVLIALGAALIVRSLVVQLALGLHDDEIRTFNLYLSGGPSAIWGHYIANDHMLYELLTWMLSTVFGHGNIVLRIWGFLPAIASVALLSWWLWRRISPWAAALVVGLIAASPVFVFLAGEGRGYGLCFLASALVLVGADSYVRFRTRRWLAMFATGAILGIWTIPVFVLPVTALAVLLLLGSWRTPKRDLVTSLVVVGLLSTAFYLPVLNDLITTSGQRFGRPLSGMGFVTGPLSDLLQPTITTLVPGITGRPTDAVTPDITANSIVDESATTITPAIRIAILAQFASVRVELIAAAFLLLGVIMLLRHGERFLAAALLVPTIFSYLTLEIVGSYVAARFFSFLLAPLVILCVAGVVWATGRLSARPLHPIAALCAAGTCAFLLVRAEGLTTVASKQLDGYGTAASILTKYHIPTVLSNRGWGVGYYFPHPFRTETARQLEVVFCHARAPFIYFEDALFPRATPSTACLTGRRAQRIPVPNRRQIPRAVWIVGQ